MNALNKCLEKSGYFIIIFFIFFNNCSQAQEAGDDQLSELLDISGISITINSMEEENLLKLATEHITDPENALTRDEKDIFMQQLRSSVLKNQVVSIMKQELTTDDVDYLLHFYKNNLMQKLLKAELYLKSPDAAKGIKIYFKNIRDQLPSKDRISKVIDIVNAALSTERAIFILAAVKREKSRALLEFYGQYNEETEQKLNYQISIYQNSVEKNIRDDIRLTSMYLYRDFTNKELTNIYELLQDKKWIKFQVAYTDAITQSLSKALNAGLKSVLNYRKLPKA